MGTAPVQTPSEPQDKVSWGASTYAGYGVASVAFVLALLAFIDGDRSEQVIGVLVPGVIGGLSFAITQIGRYVQAKAKIDTATAVAVAQTQLEGVAGMPPDQLKALVDRLEEALAALGAQKPPSTAPMTAPALGGQQ